jgi:hypothetical protein
MCISPVLTHKAGAKELRFQLARLERKEEHERRQDEVKKVKAEKNLLKKKKILLKTARLMYKCVLCDGEAIQVGTSVICTKDINHVFSSDYYGGK